MHRTLSGGDVAGFIPARRAASRKGENGTVLVVGGSYLYHGAPILSSLAALRCGVDLTYTAVPKTNVTATRAASPDIIVIPMADQKLTRGSAAKLLGAVPKGLDSAAIGMGLAIQERGALVRLAGSLAGMDVRLCLDAGALVPEVLPAVRNKNAVVTPHAGEFYRLFGRSPPAEIAGRVKIVSETAARHGITVLLKGQTDVISDGDASYLCDTGSPAMTVGGTGDVLAGLVSGILARNRSAVESAAAAAYANGLAGESVYEKVGLHAAASDIVGAIPDVMKRFDRVER